MRLVGHAGRVGRLGKPRFALALTVTGNRLSLEVVATPCRSGLETSVPSYQAMR